ncbi:MAG: hypothetical protein GX855_03460 [Firmicutes bacterium]|jgi:hypothetical protein|nr:hypothetical protein [Bacillota bacterium]
MKPIAILLLLIFLLGSTGCEPQPSQMARLGMESLGLVVEVDAPDLEAVVAGYIQNKLPKVKVIGSDAVWTQVDTSGSLRSLSALERRDNLCKLREELEIQYLAVISIKPEESPRHSTSITVGTDKTEVRLNQYLTVNLEYTIIDTASGEKVYAGQARGKSSDIADLKVGTQGTRVGIQLTQERALLKEAVRNALRETGLF